MRLLENLLLGAGIELQPTDLYVILWGDKMVFLAVVMCILGIIGTFMFVNSLANRLLSEPGGCLSTAFFLLPLGGYIYGIVGVGMEYGASAVAIFNLIGIVLGIVSRFIPKPSDSSYYHSGSSSSPSMIMRNWEESRKNDPHTCGNCAKYSSGRGECGRNGSPKSAGDSCSNWC